MKLTNQIKAESDRMRLVLVKHYGSDDTDPGFFVYPASMPQSDRTNLNMLGELQYCAAYSPERPWCANVWNREHTDVVASPLRTTINNAWNDFIAMANHARTLPHYLNDSP